MVRRHRRACRIAPLAAAPAKDRLVGSLCRLNSIWRTSRGSPGRRSVLLAGRPVRHSSLLMCRSSERSAAGFVARVLLSRPRSSHRRPLAQWPGSARPLTGRSGSRCRAHLQAADGGGVRERARRRCGSQRRRWPVSSPHCTSGRVSKRWAPQAASPPPDGARRSVRAGGSLWPHRAAAHCLPLSTASRHERWCPPPWGIGWGAGATGTVACLP